MKEELMKELLNQGASQIVANGVVWMLKTPEQEQELMDYLISVREKMIPAERLLLKANQIVHKKD